MIWHPLLLSVLTLDVLALFFLLAGLLSALQIAARWSPASVEKEQLALERRAESASIQGRTCAVLLLTSTLILIIAISGVLPDLVPGAMCGTGVLQATQGAGGRALALRALALGLVAAWHLVDRLNRARPGSPLALTASRALLLAGPVVFLAVYDTFRAVLRLDVHRPVDCCSVVYDQIRPAGEAVGTFGLPEAYGVWGLALGGIVILFLGVRLRRSRRQQEPRRTAPLALVTLCWVPLAASALVRSLAAYHYGVLQHRCPWCLFLPEHKLVGYLLFGALTLTAVEAGAAFLCSKIAATLPALEPDTLKRSRAAGLRITAATALFLALSGLPPLLWRLRFGVWM